MSKLKYVGIVALAVVLSFAASSYVRDIQVKIHQGIGWVYNNVNETAGDIIYDTNGFLFNGKGFDAQRDIKHTIHENFKSVVSIKLNSTDQSFVQNLGGQGTGFFVKVTDTHGYIATNYHVVERAIILPLNVNMTVNTATDWWTYDAEVVGVDPVSDFALIKIEKKEDEEWHALEFHERVDEEVTEGDTVVVVGHGMSLPYTASSGMVNYVNRFGTGIYTLHMQIDAVINQGNSGGPIIDLDGNVVGVAQAIYSPGRRIPGWDGVGVAISSSQAERAYKYIMSPLYASKKYVPYAEFPFSLGQLELEDVKDIPVEERHMAYIDYPEVKEGEEAPQKTVGEIAGLLQGDIIISINGEEVENSFQIMKLTLDAFPEDIWDVVVQRGKELISVKIALNEFDHTKIIKSIARIQQ